ncbi:MAG: TMEM175 family protein [Chitinophagaceae bacterium]
MKKDTIIQFTELNVNRIQALTDAVFAIVITILSLTLVIPPGENENDLKRFLLDQIIPKLFIFFLGFIVVGAFWVDTHFNHHHMVKTNIFSIWLNIFFLMFVCLIPFSSGFLANYLYTSISIIVYSLNLILVSLLHLAMLVYSWEKRFIDPTVSRTLYHNMCWRIILPTIIYILIIPLAYLKKGWVVYLFIAPLFFKSYLVGQSG